MAGVVSPVNLVPGLGEHVLILGENGEGKTTLAAGLLNEFSKTHQLVVFDTKGEEKFDPWFDTSDWAQVRDRLQEGQRRTVYRPTGSDLEADVMDSRLRDLYDTAFTGGVYLDELEHFAPTSVALPGLRYTLISGRRRKLAVGPDGERVICKLSLWMATHRPRFIPGYCKSEPKSYFVFGLSQDDLNHMRPFMHDTPLTRPDRFSWWYYRKGEMNAARMMPPINVR